MSLERFPSLTYHLHTLPYLILSVILWSCQGKKLRSKAIKWFIEGHSLSLSFIYYSFNKHLLIKLPLCQVGTGNTAVKRNQPCILCSYRPKAASGEETWLPYRLVIFEWLILMVFTVPHMSTTFSACSYRGSCLICVCVFVWERDRERRERIVIHTHKCMCLLFKVLDSSIFHTIKNS